MVRKPARPSGPGPVSEPVTVVTGSIRSQGEDDSLAVSLNICDRTLILKAGTTDLGQWPTSAVTIKPAGNGAFDFIAEGDHLIFEPDDPQRFLTTGIAMSDSTARKRSRKRKEAKERTQAQAPKPPKPRKEKPKKQPKQKRQDPAPAAPSPQAAVREASPSPPAVAKTRTPIKVRAVKGVRAKMESRAAAKANKPPKETKMRELVRDKRHQAWLFTLDQARRVDLFGLDRVPFKEHLRDDPNHEHTWDHRIAAESGLGKHICVICGKIRF